MPGLVYASITTIPSRLERLCPHSLPTIWEQNYPVEQIVLTVPRTNMRGQQWPSDKLPEFLAAEPFAPHVTVVRPATDYGPIMKYFGFLEFELPDQNTDVWVFVGDDDQTFLPEAVAILVSYRDRHYPGRTDVVIAHHGVEYPVLAPTAMGFGGLLLHRSTIVAARKLFLADEPHLPSCCKMIDDDLMAIYYQRLGIKVKALYTPFELLFRNGIQHENADALHTAHNRLRIQLRCLGHLDPAPIAFYVTLAVLFLIVVVTATAFGWRSVGARGASAPHGLNHQSHIHIAPRKKQ